MTNPRIISEFENSWLIIVCAVSSGDSISYDSMSIGCRAVRAPGIMNNDKMKTAM